MFYFYECTIDLCVSVFCLLSPAGLVECQASRCKGVQSKLPVITPFRREEQCFGGGSVRNAAPKISSHLSESIRQVESIDGFSRRLKSNLFSDFIFVSFFSFGLPPHIPTLVSTKRHDRRWGWDGDTDMAFLLTSKIE